MTTKAFLKLSKKKQRILIAKDVIENISFKVFIPHKMTYVKLSDEDSSDLEYSEIDIQKNFKLIKNCTVCALGSCLLSSAKFADTLVFKDLKNYNSDSKITELITSIFEPNQLCLIEVAFEKRGQGHGFWSVNGIGGRISSENECKAILFGCKYITDKGRLIGIMKNIIKNDGTFIP